VFSTQSQIVKAEITDTVECEHKLPTLSTLLLSSSSFPELGLVGLLQVYKTEYVYLISSEIFLSILYSSLHSTDSNCPAYNISTWTAQKTPFLCCCAIVALCLLGFPLHRSAKIIFFSAAWNIFGKLYVF
jgi:hypothetical protein